MRANHQINSLIEKFISGHPGLARTADEKAEMDASDVISRAIAGGGVFKMADLHQYGQDDDDDDDDDDDEDDEVSDLLSCL